MVGSDLVEGALAQRSEALVQFDELSHVCVSVGGEGVFAFGEGFDHRVTNHLDLGAEGERVEPAVWVEARFFIAVVVMVVAVVIVVVAMVIVVVVVFVAMVVVVVAMVIVVVTMVIMVVAMVVMVITVVVMVITVVVVVITVVVMVITVVAMIVFSLRQSDYFELNLGR